MSRNWKDGLLSSGLPLEYEVTNILLKAGFHVKGEQPYNRRNDGGSDEFSVDLRANHYLEEGCDDGSFKGELVTICECKYRNPDKSWIFMPDLNDPDFSPAWPSALRFFPTFTCYTFDQMKLKSFCYEFPSAMKGIELQEHHGEGFERDIRHAVNQLRYAMPELILSYARSANTCHPNDCRPFFILPLLITNAPLRMLRENVTLDMVRAAQCLEDISEAVEVVDLHSPHAGDFRKHCQRVFADLGVETIAGGVHKTLSKIEHYHKKRASLYSPEKDIIGLMCGCGTEPGDFSQFLVVNETSLAALLQKAKAATGGALKDSTQVVFANEASPKHAIQSADGANGKAS